MSSFKDGDHAILTRHDRTKIVQIRKERPIIIEKHKLYLDNLIDQIDGTYYELDGQQLKKLDAKQVHQLEQTDQFDHGCDNRDLCDESQNQLLQHEDIESLKSQGTSGQEIISQLVTNSSTFEKKTSFSQEKYLKKKKKKYMQIYRAWKPSIRLLCQAYSSDIQKIMFLRRDTLAMLLSLSNVSCESTVAIVESCQGLVLASVIQRCAGNGKIFNLTVGGNTNSTLPCCDFMDFPSELTNNVYTLPLENIGDKKYLINAKLTTTACANTETSSKMREQKSIVAEERRQRRIDGLELFENTKLDSLIIATKYDSLSILKHLINYLNISSHFVIYSQFVQGLLECYKYLKQRGGCIHVELSDSWLREYQILENRTHPLIRMSGTSGYLLSGIIVDNN